MNVTNHNSKIWKVLLHQLELGGSLFVILMLLTYPVKIKNKAKLFFSFI